MGAETYIMMNVGGEGAERRAAAMRRMIAERDERRAAGITGPPPEETPREKAEGLARIRFARAHAREDAARMVDVTTGKKLSLPDPRA